MINVAPSTTITCSNLSVENIRLKMIIVKPLAGGETIAAVALRDKERALLPSIPKAGRLGFDAPDFQHLPLTKVEPASEACPNALLIHGFQISLETAVAIGETNTKYAHSA